MNYRFLKAVGRVGLVAASALTLLSACQHRTQFTEDDQVAQHICQNNAFLKKYHCSLLTIEKRAAAGDADAQYALGYMYFYGVAAVRDPETAMLWINRSAAQGQPLAKRAQKMIAGQNMYVPSDQPKEQKKLKPTSKKDSPMKSGSPAPNAAAPVEVATPVQADSSLTEEQDSRTSSPVPAQPTEQAAMPKTVIHSSPNNVGYTLQLMATTHRDRLEAFVANNHLASMTQIVTVQRDQTPWYLLVYGQFSDRMTAESAKAELSSTLQAMHPWVRSFASVKAH